MIRKVTMQDVAEKAQVSKSTVSQYLNKRYEYMGDETKKRIEDAIDELEYRPNYIARSLKQKRTSTIGIIFSNILHRFSTQVSRAIEDYFYAYDYHTIVCNADDDPEKEKKYIEMLRNKQVDGLIVFPTGGNKALYHRLVEEKFPIVFVDRKVEGVPIPSVKLKNKEAVVEVLEHLVRLGHRRIAILTPPLTVTPRIERMQGYKEALRDFGLPLDDALMWGGDIADIQRVLEQMLKLPDPPTALISGNDLVLMEVLPYLKKHRIHVPEDLALITFDDIPLAELYEPGLSTMSQPAFEMGKAAATYLFKAMNETEEDKAKNTGEDTVIKDMLFEGELIIRKSSEKRIQRKQK